MSTENTVGPDGEQQQANVPHSGTAETVPQPTAPQPTAPQPTASQPTVPQSWAPPVGPPFGAPAYPQQTYAYGFPGAQPSASAAPVRAKVGAGKVAGIIVAAALVGGAAGLGGAYAGLTLFAPASTVVAAGPANVTVNDTESVNQTTGIAAKVLPSVVTISATSTSGGGTGSGAILTEDGYVVTNTHVVTLDGSASDAQIRVTTSDGRVYDAEIVGTDPLYDLAVIKLVDAEGLTPIEFADSSNLNVGDEAVAVGAPLGLANTVTTGIVSALNRSIEIASSAAPESDGGQTEGEGGESPFYFDFGPGRSAPQSGETIKIAVIQTDAAINPGNSGGALVDSDGRLIGINVAIASAGGGSGQAGSIGVGFAIPSNVVERIADEIIATGSATHGLLGATVQAAANVEGSDMTGAYIVDVTDGGAAQGAGLSAGDIVIGFNGVPISDATDLTAQVRAAAAGSDATVTYVRDGEIRTVEVTLGQLAS